MPLAANVIAHTSITAKFDVLDMRDIAEIPTNIEMPQAQAWVMRCQKDFLIRMELGHILVHRTPQQQLWRAECDFSPWKNRTIEQLRTGKCLDLRSAGKIKPDSSGTVMVKEDGVILRLTYRIGTFTETNSKSGDAVAPALVDWLRIVAKRTDKVVSEVRRADRIESSLVDPDMQPLTAYAFSSTKNVVLTAINYVERSMDNSDR